MVRTLSIANIMKMKHSSFRFEAPWNEAFTQEPSDNGFWMIWGKEKNGKTWFALLLAKYLATLTKVLYVSAEEGVGKEFCESIKRANIAVSDKNLGFLEYTPISEIRSILSKRNAPQVIFLDNMTIYNSELKSGELQRLKDEFPRVLFVFIAHEERGEPYTASAKLCKKLAKIIVHVQGLRASVSGRCKGGEYLIDEEKAVLFWGETELVNYE
jgi:hypothetical protein